jgi:hypothetical protein
MDELCINAKINEIEIQSEAEAISHKFLGSPTVRVNGFDVDPNAWGQTTYSFSCRIYHTLEGAQHYPSKDMVRAALNEALRSAQ